MPAKIILVVDSNPGVLVVAKAVLTRAGLDVVTASSVEEAVARANRHAPDLVLLDGLMSTSGVLLELVWSTSKRMPIILMAPKGHDEEIRDALANGSWTEHAEVTAIIEKPLAGDALLDATKRALASFAIEDADDAALLLSTELETPKEVRAEAPLPPERKGSGAFAALLEDAKMARTATSPWSERVETREIARFRAELQGAPPSRLTAAGAAPQPRRAEADDAETPPPPSKSDPRAQAASSLFAELSDVFDGEIVGDPLDGPAAGGDTISGITDPPEVELAPELVGEIVLSGRLGAVRVEQLLQLAADASTSICLRLEHDISTIDVFFEEGAIAFSRRHQPADWDALDLWIDERLPDPTGSRPPPVVTRETQLAIFEAVRWTDGRFVLTENEPLPEAADRVGVRLQLMPLILEGARRLDEWRRMAGELANTSAVPGRLAREDEARVLSSLSPDQRQILDEVDGQRSVEELVRTVQRPPIDVLRALARLRDERLVTLVEKIGSA